MADLRSLVKIVSTGNFSAIVLKTPLLDFLLFFGGRSTLPMSMIVEYVAILKVDFRRFRLPQRKSEIFNTIRPKRPVANRSLLGGSWAVRRPSARNGLQQQIPIYRQRPLPTATQTASVVSLD